MAPNARGLNITGTPSLTEILSLRASKGAFGPLVKSPTEDGQCDTSISGLRWQAVARQKRVHLRHRLRVPIGAHRVRLTHARRAGIEHLVLVVAARKFGADQIPRQSIQLDV